MPAQPFSVDYDAATGLATLRPTDGGTVLIERVNPTEIVFRVRTAEDARPSEDGAGAQPMAGGIAVPVSPAPSTAPSSPRDGGACSAAASPYGDAMPVSRRSSVNADTPASSPGGESADRGKTGITAEQLTAAQQAVRRAIRGLQHDASKPKDWTTEHPCDESREQCGLARPPGLGGSDTGGASEAGSHGGRATSARQRTSGADPAAGAGALQNGFGGPQQELSRSVTHPAAASPQSVSKAQQSTKSRRASANGAEMGGALAEVVHRQAHPLRQRSAGWSSDGAHGDGASSELRRGSLPELSGSYAQARAPVMHRTSWHGQQLQQQPQQHQQAMQQMGLRAAPLPPPPPQHQRLAGLLSGAPPPPPPRVQSPHARAAALTVHQGSGSPQREPTVPFGSPALRSRLAYGAGGVSQPLPQSGLAASGYAVQQQAGLYSDSPLNLLMQVKKGLDGETTAEGQAAMIATRAPWLRAGAVAAQRPITHEQFEFWSEQNANGPQEPGYQAILNAVALQHGISAAPSAGGTNGAQPDGGAAGDRMNLRTESWPPPAEVLAPQRSQQPFSPAVRQSFQYSFLGTSDSAADLMRQFGVDQGQPREPPEPPPGAPVFRPPAVASEGLGPGLSYSRRPSSVALSAPFPGGGGGGGTLGQRPPAWPWERHSDIAWHGDGAAVSGDGDAASVRTPVSLHSPSHQFTEASMGDQGYGHPVASSYASSVTGASAFDDAMAAAAAAEVRSPLMDRQRTQLDEALAHMGNVEGRQLRFADAASPTHTLSPMADSPPEHAPRPMSGGWRPMDPDAERDSRVAAIRAEFRAVAQSVVSSPRPKRWTASSARSSAASEQTGLDPGGGPNELPKFPLPEMFGFLDEDG